MATEIERKFLVISPSYKEMAHRSWLIRQGYICAQSGKTVRIRIKGDKAYLTIKGPSGQGGLSRFEWETEVSIHEADELFRLCEGPTIEKTRHLVEYEGHLFEIDEFHGDNEGLVIAEVELKKETEEIQIPPFIGEEVTGKVSYYNSNLARHPYKLWEKAPEKRE